VHIDERVSGFFAIGLARAINKPVVVVCTSGTATAELYPAIIEAYQQRIPLIVCTADRPGKLRFLGANQTINQQNLYKNHIRHYFDLDLPELSVDKLSRLKSIAYFSVKISTEYNVGPVHINFPFEKPFEPDSFTDNFNTDILSKLSIVPISDLKESKIVKSNRTHFKNIIRLLQTCERGLLIAGPDKFDLEFSNQISKVSNLLGYPIFADVASNLRFGNYDKKNVIINYDAMLRSKIIENKIKPEFILQFGRIITSKSLEDFLAKQNIPRYMINEFADWFDPANKSIASINMKPADFCSEILKLTGVAHTTKPNNRWIKKLRLLDEKIESLKSELVNSIPFPNELAITNELLKSIPSDSNIMIGNSLPIRDFDYFASKQDKDFKIFNNRGASGIDGIISTAFGIAAASNKPTFLLIGDLSFYYDLNSLLISKQLKIPLIIVLINNDGGGIFEVLPISKYSEIFSPFFKVSHQLDFKPFTKGFGGFYKKVNSWNDFSTSILGAIKRKSFSVIEVKTDAKKSLEQRRYFWKAVNSIK
jgi:2-succinyl-5-enolpyruvyl-6-hydroxy-3-cyclohexene-1-carboxylate synthase